MLEETTETAPDATAAASEHLPEEITDTAARRRTTAGLAVRQHPEHDRHQGHQHLARPGDATASPRRLALGGTTHSLSGQSTEKIVEKPHGKPPVGKKRLVTP